MVLNISCIRSSPIDKDYISPISFDQVLILADTHVIHKRPTSDFKYSDKGTLATIGRSAAVADLGRLKLSGTIAWIIWLFTHIFFLIGFRNRFIVIIQWAWSYMTFHSYSRLITYPWKAWKPGLPDKQLPGFSGCPCDKAISRNQDLDLINVKDMGNNLIRRKEQ
jgi:hypothetical protein